MAAICIDAGTSVIKAVGYDDEGTETAVVRAPAVIDRPRPGWAEQDMTAVRDAAFRAAAGVARRLGRVDFIAVTAQGDGCWLVDAAGAPTGPAVLWNDARAEHLVRRWDRAGVLTQAYARNGSVTFPGLSNAILAWLHEHDPQRVAASTAALTCGGWLVAELTGTVAAEESDASAPFVDLASGAYSTDLLDLFDLGWAGRLLPPITGDGQRVAPLLPSSAAALGLPPGTPVVAAPYDIAATAIGAGAVRPGQGCSILGTTLCTEVVTAAAAPSGAPVGLTIASGVPGRHLRAMPTLAGTEVLTWACRLLGVDHPAHLADLAAAAPVGAGGLTFLPYLSPAGERAPFLDPNASGGFLGVTLEHGPEQLARAVFEGLSLVIRECLTATATTPTELRICGGGAANDFWAQLVADVIGLPVLRTGDTEVGARGAHVIGSVAAGIHADVDAAVAAHVAVHGVHEPDPDAATHYDQLFDSFVATRRHTAGAWPGLAAARRGKASP